MRRLRCLAMVAVIPVTCGGLMACTVIEEIIVPADVKVAADSAKTLFDTKKPVVELPTVEDDAEDQSDNGGPPDSTPPPQDAIDDGQAADGSDTSTDAFTGHEITVSPLCQSFVPLTSLDALALSPRPDADAELLALEVSGALVAPTDVYARIATDLSAIRSASPELATIHVRPKFAPSVLVVGLNSDGVLKLVAGGYSAWLCQNEVYRVTLADARPYGADLHFGARYNMPLLVTAYASLPNVTVVEPLWIVGPSDDVCAVKSGTTMSYVFRTVSATGPATLRGYRMEGNGTLIDLGTVVEGQTKPWLTELAGCLAWLE